MSETDISDIVRGFLETQAAMSLATINQHGNPESAPLFYVSDERFNLYWLSSPTSRHSINLTARKQVSAGIYPSVWDWSDIVGLQVEGEAEIIGDDRIREQIMMLYMRKFKLPEDFDSAIASSTLYVLRPGWIRWLDNSVRFGYKAEIRP